MVDKNIIYCYLQELEESLKRIEGMDVTFDMILGDEDIQDLLDRRMQKAVEAVIDIAAHIVASAKLGQPKSAGDLFVILAKAKILDQKLSQRLTQAVGFRNGVSKGDSPLGVTWGLIPLVTGVLGSKATAKGWNPLETNEYKRVSLLG